MTGPVTSFSDGSTKSCWFFIFSSFFFVVRLKWQLLNSFHTGSETTIYVIFLSLWRISSWSISYSDIIWYYYSKLSDYFGFFWLVVFSITRNYSSLCLVEINFKCIISIHWIQGMEDIFQSQVSLAAICFKMEAEKPKLCWFGCKTCT